MKTSRAATGRGGLVLGLMLLAPGAAPAHALGADCTLRGGRVEVEAYFSDDTAARGATVRVLDARKRVVAEGHTDNAGHWSFAAPPPGRYVVAVGADAGHTARVKVTIPVRTAAKRPSGASPRAGHFPGRPVQVSEGPSRQAFTRFPWLRAALGVGLIAALAWVAWLARHRRQPRGAPPARTNATPPDASGQPPGLLPRRSQP
jgi:hypothetical protein